MTIHVEDLKFQCIIGILDFERTIMQDVIVNLKIKYDFKGDFINYATIVDKIKSLIIDNKFFLIEDALSRISDSLHKEYPQISALYLKITKPSILPDCKLSVSRRYKFNS